MKKRVLILLLLLCMVWAPVVRSQAKTFNGDPGWQVNFTPRNEMESNFTTANLTELISGMQPGDDAIINLALRNTNSATTDWYMTNEVLSSLEDSVTVASGGAYTYQLSYTKANGETTVLFDSDTVGGENVSTAGEGLNEVTNALDEFFFLDTLKTGESGMITLRVVLDGETQGNDYQDTLAKLQMNFAVELQEPESRRVRRVVKTGDDSMLPYVIAAGISGLLLLAFAIYSLRERRGKNAKKTGKKAVKSISSLLFLAMVLAGLILPGNVAKADGYTYTIRVYAGAQGTINGEKVIEYKDQPYGTEITFDLNSVKLGNDNKYYAKGIRESGKDNNTVRTNLIKVTQDMDYVVAYGLKGSSVAYTVYYVDTAGNELYPATTYYGNVGDKPVVSYQYVEGYQPQAYNMTRTLVEDPAENVFTFTYTRIAGTGGGVTVDETVIEGGGGAAQPAEGGGAGGAGGEGGEGGQLQGGGGENTGTEPEELQDLDVPLANPVQEFLQNLTDASSLPFAARCTIGGCVLLGLAFLAWLLLVYKRRDEDEEEA